MAQNSSVRTTEQSTTDYQFPSLERLPNSLNSFKKIFIDTIYIEWLSRVSEKHKEPVSLKCVSFAANIKLHTLFTKQGLESISQIIFSGIDTETDGIFRDFILSLTDIYFIEIQGGIQQNENESISMSLSKILAENIGGRKSKNQQKNSLIPLELQQVLNSSDDLDVKAVVNANDWLVVIIMMVLTMNDLVRIFNQQDVKVN